MASYQSRIPEGERIAVGLQASEVTFSEFIEFFVKNEDLAPSPPMNGMTSRPKNDKYY